MPTTFSTSSSATAPGNSSGNAWTLSNSNLTASKTPGGTTSVTSTTALSGLRYWETTMAAVGNDGLTGIGKSGASINANLGVAATDYGYSSTGFIYNNNVHLAGASVNTFAAGDVIGHAYDATNGNYWVSKNGTWQNSATIAEIAAGTTTHAIKTGLSGSYYPTISNGSGAGGGIIGTLTVATPLQFPIPTGYQPLDAATLSMTASPLSYAFTLSSITGKRALHLMALPISYAFTLTANVMHWGRYMAALPISFAFSLVATILAAVISPASKLKRRITAFVFSSTGRSAAPTLED